tara:strand:+ start:4303 stop:4983 length:681 start_codon:yes stop_codon:yes gene_type:complete
MRKFIFGLCIITSLFSINLTNASDTFIDGDFEISHFEIVELPIDKSEEVKEKDFLQEVVYVVDTLIAVGKKIYEVVDAGRPVVNAKFNNVSVLPKTEGGNLVNPFYDMAGWSAPVHKKYRITFKNLYGVEVISFTYGVSMQFGGKFNDTGAYILGANIYPEDLNVLWGWNLDANVETVSISNTSSLNDPVASLQLKLDGKVTTPLVENRFSHVFYLTGDGQIVSNR